jgi:DNA-binding transcriptional ArsR family regulator
VTLRIDITGMPTERLRFAVSPLAELAAMLHVLAGTAHHPRFAAWAAGVRGALRPELAERLQEAEFLWRSSRADFLLPARPKASLKEELDDVDRIDDEPYVLSALVTTCGSNRVHFGDASPLTDAAARERALDQAQARGAVQEAFAERLLADPAAVRRRVRETLEQCAEAFFDTAWADVLPRLAADAQVKTDLRERGGIGPALAAVSAAVTHTSRDDGDASIVVDKLQDNATSARTAGVTLIPTVFGSPHLVAVHAPGWRPVMQYPVAGPGTPDHAVSMETIERRLQALAHPVRLRLVRTLARSPHTTGELAGAWELTAPEVSRHLAVLRKAGLLQAERRGRYVYYSVDAPAVSALGTDLLSAVLR